MFGSLSPTVRKIVPFNSGVLVQGKRVRIPQLPQFYGLACTKAGDVPLQGTCGEFDSLRVHK